jgi:hypothetical protein
MKDEVPPFGTTHHNKKETECNDQGLMTSRKDYG